MQIIIMCGGVYDNFEKHKSLSVINNETLIERTIRLLKQNGIEDYYISSNDDNFKKYGKVLKHTNTYKYENGIIKGYDAIKKILELKPKVNTMVGNQYALNKNHDKVGEPFGWIVVDQKSFREAIDTCKKLQDEGKIDRGYAISWELYEVLNGHDINDFIITEDTYLAIYDETIDIDEPSQIQELNKKVSG